MRKTRSKPVIFLTLCLISACVPLIDTPPDEFCNNTIVRVTEHELTFSVFARDHHCSSGALLDTGETYQFHIKHIDSSWEDGDGRGLSHADGLDETGWTHRDLPWYLSGVALTNRFRRCPAANWFEIVGIRLNEDKQAVHFRIGAGISSNKVFTYTGPSSQPLIVYANDLSNRYHNNHGKMLMGISKISHKNADQFEQYQLCF